MARERRSRTHRIPRIYYAYNGRGGFLQRDREWLEQRFYVDCTPPSLTVRGVLSTCAAVWRCDLVYCWFAGRNAAVAVPIGRLLMKRVIVVAGGFDVASVSSIDYGSMRGGLRSFATRMILRMAHTVVSVSAANRDEAISNGRVRPERITLIRHGFSDTPREGESVVKERIVITIGEVRSDNLYRKGLAIFARASVYSPTLRWILVGKVADGSVELLQRLGGPNLEVVGYLPREKLVELMRLAMVYVQASAHEAFGCSLAEAMIEECIPVVTDRGALPEVVGDAGLYSRYGDASDLARVVERAMGDVDSLGLKARSRVLTLFSYDAWDRNMGDLFGRHLGSFGKSAVEN